METSKSRMGIRVQTLMRNLEKLKIAKEALKMRITSRNKMRELTEPAELHDVVKSNRKINKKGEYRMGGKVKKLSDNQMKMRKENYGPGAIARSLRAQYQQSGGVQKTSNTQSQRPPFQERLKKFKLEQNSPIQFTNPAGYIHPQTFGNQSNASPTGTQGTAAISPVTASTTATASTASKPSKKVKDFRVLPDGTIIPNVGYGSILSYEKDKNGSPVIKTMKGIDSFDATTGEIKFTKDEAGKKAEEIWNNAKEDPTTFMVNYIEAANEEMIQAGEVISYDDLYKYTDDAELTKKYLKAAGKDKMYGKEHEALLGVINNVPEAKADFLEWVKQGQSPTWTQDKIDALAYEQDEQEIDEVEDELTEDEQIEEDTFADDSTTADVAAPLLAEDEEENVVAQMGLTQGEKIGMATGAVGRLGGIAAALSNKPQRAFNAFQGASTRAEDSLSEAIRKSRTGVEQTAAQIKAQGNLARKVARDTSNSWAQRYAASLGAQRLTDEGLIKNRNMWEQLYGGMKGKQAGLRLRGDMASAQGAMQVQDWFQRDKDSYLTGLGQEGQNLTNYGASMAGLSNMSQFRNQQLQALSDMGTYFNPQIDENGEIINIAFGKNKKKKKP